MTSTSAFRLPPPAGLLSASRLRGGGGGGARRGPAFGLLARAAPAADDDGGSESDANSEEEYVGGTAPEGLVQDLTVRRIAGDGRCMFRALVSSEAMRRERGEGAGRPG